MSDFMETLQDEVKELDTIAPVVQPKVKVKKEKPVIRIRRRRIRKGMISTAKKLIREEMNYGIQNIVIQFPEELEEQYKPELIAIPRAYKPESGAGRMPYDPKGDTPNDQLTYLSVYKVPASEETLQLVAKFGRRHRFDFDSDIAVRAQLSSEDGKKMEKLSYQDKLLQANREDMAKLGFKLKFKFNIDPKTKKHKTPKRLAPMPFQEVGIYYSLLAKKNFIADEMGLGKTIQAIGTAAYDAENVTADGFTLPWLVIAPRTLRINWWKEFTKWLPKNRFSISMIRNKFLQTTPKHALTAESRRYMKSHDVYVMTYDKIHRYGEQLKKFEWRGIIFDESHYMKARGTKRSRVIKEWIKEMDPEFILELSGTPTMNRPMDFISQLQVMDRLQDFGGFNNFMMRYCQLSSTDESHVSEAHKLAKAGVVEEASAENGNTETIDVRKMMRATTKTGEMDEALKAALVRKVYENMIALNKSLRSTCMVRREKSDVLDDLPAKTRQTISIEITNRKLYEKIEADVIGYLMDQVASDEKFLKSIAKLPLDTQHAKIAERRAAAAMTGERAKVLVQIEKLKQAAAVGKMQGVKEWIDNYLDTGKKLVVFATHNTIMNELVEMYPDALQVRSHMSEAKREEAIEQFQENKKKKLIIVGLKLAVGMTLTAASDTCTIEFGWTSALHDQAEDRTHRIGQKNAVTAYYLVARKTIEEKIGRLIENKRRMVNATTIGDPLHGSESGSVLGDLLGELTGAMGLYR